MAEPAHTFDPSTWHAPGQRSGPSELPLLALPHEVCPKPDSPLLFIHRVGWALMNQRWWPVAALQNPIIYYLTGRRRSVHVGDAIATVPYILLYTIEIAFLVISIRRVNFDYWLMLLAAELLFLPALEGMWCQAMVFMHFHYAKRTISIEEIATTCIETDEQIAGLFLRPICTQMGVSFLFCMLTLMTIPPVVLHQMLQTDLLGFAALPMIIIGLLYRAYYMRHAIQFAAILGVRCNLFIVNPMKSLLRAFRDWILPWGMVPLIYTILVIGSFVVQQYTVAFIFLVVATPLIGFWMLFHIPTLMSDYAEETMYWLEKSYGKWSMQTGEEHPGVPGGFLSPWKLACRPDRKRK